MVEAAWSIFVLGSSANPQILCIHFSELRGVAVEMEEGRAEPMEEGHTEPPVKPPKRHKKKIILKERKESIKGC